MTIMNLMENKEFKKYVESYKRLFFRKQLDNPKSNLILDKKRESLGLSKEEVCNIESLLNKNLVDSIEFISAIMDLNANVDLSKDDLIEIDEYCKDLSLEEDDIKNCLSFAKQKYEQSKIVNEEISLEIEQKDLNEKFANSEEYIEEHISEERNEDNHKEIILENKDFDDKEKIELENQELFKNDEILKSDVIVQEIPQEIELEEILINNEESKDLNLDDTCKEDKSLDFKKKNKSSKKKTKKASKKVENKSDDEHIPSFKQRTKEILKVDNISQMNNESEDIKNIYNKDAEEVETLALEVLQNEKLENDYKADIEEFKLYENNIDDKISDNYNLNNDNDEMYSKIDEVVAQVIADKQNKDLSTLDNKLLGGFDEDLDQEKIDSTSFLIYEKGMLSEENMLDKILDLESREFRLETLKTMFYNGCLICVERFKDNIFSVRGRRSFTKENIRAAFYDSYDELINYTHAFLTKEGINDNSIEKQPLFERIFGLQCLETLSKQINKINTMIDNGVSESQILNSIDRSIGIYKANSDKPHFKTFAVRSISRDIKVIFEGAKTDYNLRDNIEQGIYKLILEAVEFINKCGLANFDIYTEDHGRSLNNLLETKSKIKEVLAKYEDNRKISDEEYAKLLKEAIIAYPFFEDTYVELSKVEKINIRKYNLLNSAIELLNKCGESARNIINEIVVVEKILYKEEIKKIDITASLEVKKALCEESASIYKVFDFDTIFEIELEHFGFIVSNIEIISVSEETRIKAFKKDLLRIKEENLNDELKQDRIQESKEKYYIRNWESFKAEYAIFGKSFEGNVFADLDRQDRLAILDYCMKSIQEVTTSGKEKRDLLSLLQERHILDKKDFRKIEKDIFDFVIPLTEEEIIEFDFMEKINKIYSQCEDVKALDISIKNKKWEIEIPAFYNHIMDMQADYEPIIMVYKEDDKTGKNKEGFVITDRAIYSSYAKRFLKFNEIESIKLRNYSKIKKGERISYDGIFAEVDHKDYKLCSNYMGSKGAFAQLLNDVLDSYRELNGLEPLERPEENIEDNMLLGIDSENMLFGDKRLQEELKVNLEENKYYELMSDLLNYDNLTFKEILIELSRLVNKEIADKIFFSEITEGSGEKIREACSSYVTSISELEEIYLVIDNTKKFPLQFQKLGIVISSKAIYCKNRLEDPWVIELKYANNIKTKDENKIQITNRIIEFPQIRKKQDLYDLRDLIEFVVVLRKIMDNSSQESESRIDGMQVSPAEKFTTELVNKIQSEELRKMLFMYDESTASEKRFNAAMSSYADLDDIEKPMLLLDTSMLGVKTSGLLITDKNMYYKENMSNSLNINLLAVSRVYMKNDKFYVNGIEFKLSSLNLEEKTEFAQKLSKLVDFLKETGFKRI